MHRLRRRFEGWMTTSTAYQWARLCARFEQYRRTDTTRPLAEAVQGWLRSLPPSQQIPAKCALKRHLGKAALDWDALEVARHHRNESTLIASVLGEAHRARIRAATLEPRDRALIECLFTLRRFEVAALRWTDLDLVAGSVSVRKGKGNKASWTLLTEGAQTALAAWQAVAAAPPDGPVFPALRAGDLTAHHYTPGGIGKLVQRILTRAGCWTRGAGCAHRFRRTMATEYLRANAHDLVGLQRVLRHERIDTTSLYVFFQPGDLAPRLAKVRL